MAGGVRAVPRPFKYHWGSGQIIEEAAFVAEHHEPAIQLLEYDEGDAAGGVSVRFCYYSRDGRFQRSPLVVGDDEIAGLRRALAETPRLRALLRKLLED
jgi:hypothetical protein